MDYLFLKFKMVDISLSIFSFYYIFLFKDKNKENREGGRDEEGEGGWEVKEERKVGFL